VTVEAFLKEHNVRYAARIEERVVAMKQCMPLTTDAGVVLPGQQKMVPALLPQIISAIEAIAEYDTRQPTDCMRAPSLLREVNAIWVADSPFASDFVRVQIRPSFAQ
jgi:hypothetical protein